jgi:hypothetical protein
MSFPFELCETLVANFPIGAQPIALEVNKLNLHSSKK